MNIAILGTRGIPNNYGGFEQCAEYLSVGLVRCGHNVTVYNPVFHPYKKNIYKGVRIVRKFSPQKFIGVSASNFVYDYLCFKDASKHQLRHEKYRFQINLRGTYEDRIARSYF